MKSKNARYVSKNIEINHEFYFAVPEILRTYSTHRGLIEPLSGRKHLKHVFIRRFLQFIDSIRHSTVPVIKAILGVTVRDTRATTGKNHRVIMILMRKLLIEVITPEDSDLFEYFSRPVEEEWKTDSREITSYF